MAKLIDDAPVFVITFVAQQMNVVRDTEGSIVEGDEVMPHGPITKLSSHVITGEY